MSEQDNKHYFDGEFDVLVIKPDAHEYDIRDMITQRLTQLNAMISMQSHFKAPDNPRTRQQRYNHLWLFNRTVSELQSLSLELWHRQPDE